MPPLGAHGGLEAGVAQRGLERAAREEADVLAERVEVRLEARQRDRGGLEAAVVRDGRPQPPARPLRGADGY